MRNNFEVSTAASTTGLGNSQPGRFSWRSAILGAAIGIAGPAYFGTLFGNLTLRLLLSQGNSIQEAYAYLCRYSFTLPVVVNLAADLCFAIACGAVSVAYGRGAVISQGVAAGLFSVSFPIVMFLSPTDAAMPFLFQAISLAVPVFGSVVGAYAYARKT